MEFLVNRGYSLRQAQSKTNYVILSSSLPVILSSFLSVILNSSKDDHRRRLRVGDPVPLRQAQSDSRVQSNSEAQSNTYSVILSSSKDDPIEGLKY